MIILKFKQQMHQIQQIQITLLVQDIHKVKLSCKIIINVKKKIVKKYLQQKKKLNLNIVKSIILVNYLFYYAKIVKRTKFYV